MAMQQLKKKKKKKNTSFAISRLSDGEKIELNSYEIAKFTFLNWQTVL